MDLETAQTNTTTKLPLLKQGEYDMWKLRIEQYFQVQDYALWDVIENGNSFKPAAQTTTNVDGSSTTLIPGPITADEKTQKKNDVKARSMLLMALPNEHLLTFNQYKDAKTLFAAIQTRFGGNDATKKTQKTLLKQITNEVNTAYGVSTANTQVSPASTQVSTASTQVSTANLSDDTVYAFLASQPNGSQLVHEDLEQIHEDDLEEMDLKWQLALLSMRTRKFFQKTGRKITINGSDTTGYDKSKVECFNCHKLGHFARECRGPRNQDNRSRNQDSSRRTINVEEISSKAMLAIDGAGFDWSFMADEEVPTNMALMAFLDSEFSKSEFNLATYKRGLASIEEQLVFYKKNEVLFYEQLVVLKRDISYKDLEISVLESELEKLKQEKERNQLKIEKFDNASKSLDKLIGSQIPDKSRKGLGFVSYNDVPPLPIGLFLPLNLDLSNSGLEEFQQPEFEGYGPKTSKNVSEDTYNEARESPDASLVEELTAIIIKEKGWNIVPRAVLMKTDLRPLNTARPVNTAHPKTTVYSARPMPKAVNTARPNSVVVNAVRANQTSRNLMEDMLPLGEEPKEEELLVKELLKLNSVLFIDTGCFVLSLDFKLADESQVLLKLPKKNNMYIVDTKNIVPKESLTCLVAKATLDESMLWHRRLGHVNFKTINKLVKDNLVKGLPIKRFENDQTCVACLKGKQHKASFMSEFCEKKGIKREFSVARTPQQNGVAKRRNRTLIEAGRTILADSKLPTIFWAEAVNTACYVQNRILVVKPQNKTSYELFRGITPSLSFMKPFGCHVTILNTLDHLDKFNGKYDDGFFVGYSFNSKAFRVCNIRTRKVEENFHVRFLEDKPIMAGDGTKWLCSNDEPQPSNDAEKKDDEGGIDDQESTENSAQDVNTARPSINTGSINFNTSSLYINTVSPTVPTAPLESTYANFFGDKSELDLSNIAITYPVPSTPNTRIHKDHSLDHVIGDMQSGVQTRRMINEQGKSLKGNPSIKISKLDRSYARRASAIQITTSLDIEEGIDYDEVFAPVARIEAIRLFLAYASFKDFVVYQMDVKSTFLYGKIEEEVYVCQPSGFEDLEFPDKVYKVEKALYGLHQAPRAWYETLSIYFLDNGFQRGQIDKTLFIKRIKSDILLVQVYVDDIIVGSTKKELCTDFENHDKYVDEILKKFGFSTVKTTSTPMETSKPLLKDAEAEDVDVHL
ncbi:retrovirus-related pol polyprotein from transposon TNT 1-94 [Tanacetum coccineum]